MKILNIIAGLNDGGAEAVLYRLCVHDSNYKHIVISLMNEGKYILKASESDGRI